MRHLDLHIVTIYVLIAIPVVVVTSDHRMYWLAPILVAAFIPQPMILNTFFFDLRRSDGHVAAWQYLIANELLSLIASSAMAFLGLSLR